METFSLLQTSLRQTIDRKSLEDASVAVRSVARTDCAKLQRELFGMVVSGLAHEEALAFQAELMRRNFPTEVVADRDLPLLHESFQIQRIEHRDEVLLLTDSLGQVRTRPLTDLVFVAGGYLKRVEFKTEWHPHIDFSASEGGGMPRLTNEREYREEIELNFRLDFFFWSSPNRIHTSLHKDTVIFHQGNPLRLRDAAGLRELMSAMGHLLPAERLSSSLRDPLSARIYPTLACYEEEIRWHFHHLKTSA